MSRIYLYKLTTDNGGAPCVASELLTLCICKPGIRSTARVGDVLIGVAANSLYADNRLIYVARITDKLIDGEYFRNSQYRNRGDCIYDWHDGVFTVRRGAAHHGQPGDLEHDLGPPPDYPKAKALLSREFRYFGDYGSDEYKTMSPRVARLVGRLKQGHRVNHGLALERELAAVIDWAFVQNSVEVSARATSGKRRCGVRSRMPPREVAKPRWRC